MFIDNRPANVRLSVANASAIGLLRGLLAASILVPITLFGIVTWLNYHNTIADAEHDLQRTSEVGSENAEKVFGTEAQLADRVNDLARNLDAASIEASEKSLHDTLNGMIARLPHVASVMIASRNGMPLVSGERFPVPHGLDLHSRDYFNAIMGGDKGPFISSLRVGDIYPKPFFGLARPWTGPDGSLKGVIDVVVAPAFFEDFYQSLVEEGIGSASGKVVTLVRETGQILARYPPFQPAPANGVTPAEFLAAIKASPDEGVYSSRSIVDPDAPRRLFAYHRVRGFPLYVAAGRSWSAILAEWRWSVLDHLLFGVPATLVLFGVTWTALARTRREEQALLRAKLEIQRREAAEDALLRAQRLEAVGQMTGGVAHDFNNLLTVIAGNAALIEKRADDAAAARRFATNIQLAAQRGAEITQQLLAFAGRQTIRPETIDLNERLRTFKPLLDRAASEAVEITLDLAAGLPPVSVDPGQFESAMLNLVGNARDAMAGPATDRETSGGRITITTRYAEPGWEAAQGVPSEPAVQVTVADNGTGMDRETLAKAFEPFFTTKPVGKGTGLGLSQVYGFARQAGGDVRIFSTQGVGTTIQITLPAAEQATLEDARPTSSMPWADSCGTVILVVEDNPDVRELAVATLDDLGYVTLEATGGRDALEQLVRTDRVDVLFTDMVMAGGMSGLQLAKEAKRLRPAIKVLLTSGYTGLSGEDLPDDIPLLLKPYDGDQLSARLEAVLQA